MKNFCYEYERPAVTVDAVIFGFAEASLKVLLIKRGIEPFKDKWALPGGFIQMQETAEDGANRILKKETNLEGVFMEQLYTFSAVNRDPRERIISIAYFALVKQDDYQAQAGDDETSAEWFEINKLPSLVFDHEKILRTAMYRLKGKIRYQPIGFELLTDKFKLSQLQDLYEVILETSIDKRNFRRKILQMELLIDTEEKEKNVAHKAAKLYKFDKNKYDELSKKGFNFEI
ncbi:MAG: NUDIX hydrolase [Bacteroidales bacterium]|nr:NUDIX hydrolase [Bacteroidales bacterium]